MVSALKFQGGIVMGNKIYAPSNSWVDEIDHKMEEEIKRAKKEKNIDLHFSDRERYQRYARELVARDQNSFTERLAYFYYVDYKKGQMPDNPYDIQDEVLDHWSGNSKWKKDLPNFDTNYRKWFSGQSYPNEGDTRRLLFGIAIGLDLPEEWVTTGIKDDESPTFFSALHMVNSYDYRNYADWIFRYCIRKYPVVESDSAEKRKRAQENRWSAYCSLITPVKKHMDNDGTEGLSDFEKCYAEFCTKIEENGFDVLDEQYKGKSINFDLDGKQVCIKDIAEALRRKYYCLLKNRYKVIKSKEIESLKTRIKEVKEKKKRLEEKKANNKKELLDFKNKIRDYEIEIAKKERSQEKLEQEKNLKEEFEKFLRRNSKEIAKELEKDDLSNRVWGLIYQYFQLEMADIFRVYYISRKGKCEGLDDFIEALKVSSKKADRKNIYKERRIAQRGWETKYSKDLQQLFEEINPEIDDEDAFKERIYVNLSDIDNRHIRACNNIKAVLENLRISSSSSWGTIQFKKSYGTYDVIVNNNATPMADDCFIDDIFPCIQVQLYNEILKYMNNTSTYTDDDLASYVREYEVSENGENSGLKRLKV